MKAEVVIIGSGLTGLSAGMELGDKAVMLEKGTRPGGLVKTFNFDGYWFDNVVHLLHFRNPETERCIKELMGGTLKSCPLAGWVETREGTARYPLQLNLGSFKKETAKKCVNDFINRPKGEPASYKEFLLNTFGATMCDIFFYPYNEKQWKFPLDAMTSSGQIWNINQPTLADIIEGIEHPESNKRYL